MDNQNQKHKDRKDHKKNNQKQNQEANRDLESRWNEIESNYRRRHPNVTDEDVDYEKGEFDSMTNRVAKSTNRSRDQINEDIGNWHLENDKNNNY
ncbi:hypothetical protein ESY86_06915 [Subsaximicrobium wynnwilliamsii]|uniref:CsbD family protein n=1 Tax=Subsaximicrobium wynnwilliamsii TaxID=291179 RepID=A0A5C6ZJ36_9FLAO|nr:hypothetical protein [Subsaximicrobium wynnwilliamsii]TXD81561.1 hypothetical protein ESY87_17530 [Subsaximicrobium wynnwilliamsii]TXD89923.1 hypothetical protein ESY86_06915 [Subsaximicrobium wynnwilliamsii]TXE01022.1 hypothetical protein ESY88_17525 [Subsaximicrobium wynnwilliamsii]